MIMLRPLYSNPPDSQSSGASFGFPTTFFNVHVADEGSLLAVVRQPWANAEALPTSIVVKDTAKARLRRCPSPFSSPNNIEAFRKAITPKALLAVSNSGEDFTCFGGGAIARKPAQRATARQLGA
jgi:hypothetical protein